MFLNLLMVLTPALQAVSEGDPPDDDLHFRLQASAWLILPSGWLSITRGSKPGTATSLNVGDEFALNRKVEPFVEAAAQFGRHHGIETRFWTVSLDGTSVDEDAFIFHGETFDAGRKVRSEVDFLMLDAGYRYTFNPDGAVQITGHLGAEYWLFKARLRTTDAPPTIDTSRRFGSAFWRGGVDATIPLSGAVQLSGLLAGSTERHNQYFFEAQATSHIRLWDHAALALGYRFHSIHFRQSTNLSGLNFYGPFLGMEMRF